MELPQNTNQLTIDQYARWRSGYVLDPLESEIDGILRLMGVDGPTDPNYIVVVREYVAKVQKEPNYYQNLLLNDKNFIPTGGAKTVYVSVGGQSIALMPGEDLYNTTFGAAAQILELHDSIVSTYFEEPANKQFLASLEGKMIEQLTANEKLNFENINFRLFSDYLLKLPDFYAWVLLGKAKIPITLQNFNACKAAIEAHKNAPALLSIFDGFFLTKTTLKIYNPPYSGLYLLYAQLVEFCQLSIPFGYLLATLAQGR